MPKKVKGPKPVLCCPSDVREIRLLATSFYEIQECRIKIGNRIAMLRKDYGVDLVEASTMHNDVFPRLEAAEEAIGIRVREYARQYPIFTGWIQREVKGVAEILTGGLLAGIRDIGKFDTVSKLWKYCGVGIHEDGNIQKRQKGQTIDYSPFCKVIVWKLGEQFVKIGDRGYYGLKYREFKEQEQRKAASRGLIILPHAAIDALPEEQRADKMSEGHVHNRAKRKVAKLFLSHLWWVWREMEGLPVRNPYVVEKFPEHHYEPPPGWPVRKAVEVAD